MKTLIRTIIVCIAVNLMITGFVPAQDSSGNATLPETQRKAEILTAEIEAGQAQEQAEAARRDNEALKEQLKALTVTVPEIRIPSFTTGTSFGGGGSVLVIPTTQIEMEDVIAINEDMNVMSRIFEENLSKERLGTTGNTSMFLGYGDPFGNIFRHGHSNLQTLYLQGYGAIFMMNVDFPLSPPPQEPEQQEEEKTDESSDQVWEQTKKQMFEPQKSARHTNQTPKKEYDAEKVELLKTTLTKSLKHAANIRAIKPDESVVLTITGSGDSAGSPTVTRKIVVEGNMIKATDGTESGDAELSPPMKLVIRAKKSDIDAVANGQTDMEKFLENVQIIDCPYLSTDMANQVSTTVRSTTSSTRRGRSSGSTGGMYDGR